MNKLKLILLSLFLMSLLASCVYAQSVVIIANKDVEEDSFNHQTLLRIYHGKKKQWSNNNKIVPVMLKSGLIRDRFIEDILKETDHKFITFWKQMVFTGRGIPPKSFINEKEIVNFVAQTPGAIGYISKLPSSISDDVKLISIIEGK